MGDACEFSVEVSPSELRPGGPVTIEVRITHGAADVESVGLSLPEHGIWETCRRTSPDSFAYTGTIPWEAPPDTYRVNVTARDAAGEVRASRIVPIRVA